MSRSNPQPENPAQQFYRWSGKKGKVLYWDSDKEEEIYIDLPFAFLLLDELACVTGYHRQSDSSIYSNEVKNITREPLTVRTGDSGILEQGFYTDIKESVKAKGGKYTASLYVACKNEQDELFTANIKLRGAAFSEWMEFSRRQDKKDLYDNAILIQGAEWVEGEISYYYPVFNLKSISEEADRKAKEMDKELQEYIQSRQEITPSDGKDEKQAEDTGRNQESEPVTDSIDLNEKFDDIDDDLPF